jgi:hypothetical protein
MSGPLLAGSVDTNHQHQPQVTWSKVKWEHFMAILFETLPAITIRYICLLA